MLGGARRAHGPRKRHNRRAQGHLKARAPSRRPLHSQVARRGCSQRQRQACLDRAGEGRRGETRDGYEATLASNTRSRGEGSTTDQSRWRIASRGRPEGRHVPRACACFLAGKRVGVTAERAGSSRAPCLPAPEASYHPRHPLQAPAHALHVGSNRYKGQRSGREPIGARARARFMPTVMAWPCACARRLDDHHARSVGRLVRLPHAWKLTYPHATGEPRRASVRRPCGAGECATQIPLVDRDSRRLRPRTTSAPTCLRES